MRIGIDAKWYFSGPSSGLVVVRNLVNSIINVNMKHVIVLFVLTNDIDQFSMIFSVHISAGRVEILPINGRWNFILNIFNIQRLAIKNNIDVVLYQNFIPFWPSKKIKTVAYIHDFLFLDYPEFFTHSENIVYRLMKFLIPNADHVITISHSEKSRIVKHTNILKENISVIYHGVSSKFQQISDKEKQDIKEKYRLPNDYILYIGRINRRKNVDILLKSLSYITPRTPIVLIGKKEHKSYDIDKLASMYDINKEIIHLGYIPENDLVSILAASTVFCFPSFIEGFGLPPLEAMKSGIAVVTTSGTSLPEVCEDAVIYFEPSDYLGLARSIESVINNSELRQSLVKKGLVQASKFSWDNSANKLLNILESVYNDGEDNTIY